jgi:cytochrome c
VKHSISLILVLAFIVGCHSSKKATVKKKNNVDQPEYRSGLELIASSDCYVCHKIESRLVGPSFIEIATKYKDQPEAVSNLEKKIITGGYGDWGKTPMVPHPAMTTTQAEIIVRYILTITK